MLPGAVEEYAGFAQYWDDERRVSAEVKARILPDYEDDVPWDLFILFDGGATWANASDHVLGWGEPVIEKTEQLERLLASL